MNRGVWILTGHKVFQSFTPLTSWLSLGFGTVECNIHTEQCQAIRLRALLYLFLGWWVANLQLASSISTAQIISVTFSFSQLFANLIITYFPHHKKLLQADIHVCTLKYESHGCKNQEILQIFKSPRFLVLYSGSVWDVWRTKMTASVMAGTQWDGRKKMQEELRKNIWTTENMKSMAQYGKGWQDCTCAPHVWGLAALHSDQTPLLLHVFRSLMAMVFSAGELQCSNPGSNRGVVHWS